MHWKRVNGHRWEGTRETVVIATVTSGDVKLQRPITVRMAHGVLVDCPTCGRSAIGATSPAKRLCPDCGTTVAMNEEEVAWLSAPLGLRAYET